MVQATTPTIIMDLPETVDLTQAQTIVFSLVQGSTNIKKTITDAEAHKVSVFLSQTETLGLFSGTAQVQLNWTYPDGNRACTNIVNINVTPNLLKAVMA
jgi:hypothetical protein